MKAGDKISRVLDAGDVNVVDDKKRIIDLSFSSETPIDEGEYITVLSHEPGAMNMARLAKNAPLLYNHKIDNMIGAVQRAYVKDRKGRAVVKISRHRDDVWHDIEDGILCNVSVGAIVDEVKRSGERNGKPVYYISRFTPYEISLVSAPADVSVGIGRGLDFTTKEITEVKETKTMEENKIEVTGDRMSRGEVKEILAIARAYNEHELAEQFIDAGRGVTEFKDAIIKRMAAKQPALTSQASPEVFPREEARKYNIARAIRAVIEGNFNNTYEHEVHQHLSRVFNKPAQGILVPSNVIMRDMSTGTNNYLVGTETRGDLYVDAFRNEPLVVRAGAQQMPGLVGNVSIPALTGSGTTEWVQEGSGATGSDLTVSQLTLSPHTITGNMTYTRKLMLQSTPQIQQLIENDLSSIVALGIDKAALCGTGSSYEPEGIVFNANVCVTSTGGTITYNSLLEMEEDVSTYNGLKGSLAFVCPPSVRKSLRGKFINVTYGEQPIWQAGSEKDAGSVLGYRAFCSNQVVKYSGKDVVIFGDFSQLVIGQWGAVDLIVDPYTESKQGNVTITIFSDVDVLIRHPKSFAVIRDLN